MSPDSRVYGHIQNVPVGKTFRNRDALIKAGVHGQSQAGIHGDSRDGCGAFSICISEGYEDNRDLGDRIIYVGSGGQNSSGEQIADQSFTDARNKALQISCETRRPVRVIRGKNKKSHYAPASGYRFDGLYVVDVAEMRQGKQGFNMCFFELTRLREEGDHEIPHRRLLTTKTMARMLRRVGRR